MTTAKRQPDAYDVGPNSITPLFMISGEFKEAKGPIRIMHEKILKARRAIGDKYPALRELKRRIQKEL